MILKHIRSIECKYVDVHGEQQTGWPDIAELLVLNGLDVGHGDKLIITVEVIKGGAPDTAVSEVPTRSRCLEH